MDPQLWHDYCTSVDAADPVPLSLRQWKRLAQDERRIHIDGLQRWISQLFIETEEMKGVTDAIANTLRRNKDSPPGAKEIFALSGPNAVGKSTFMMRWGRERYLQMITGAATDERGRPVMKLDDDCEADLCPVTWTHIPAKAAVKVVNQLILGCYGLPGDGDVGQLTTNAVRAARRHGTQILIFDDVHLLYTDWKGGRFVLDHIKHINTELGYTGTTLVLVGANIEDSVLVRDPQIAGRLTMKPLAPYQAHTIDERRAWQGVVRQLEERVLPHLPAGEPGMLFLELAGELWLRTQGFLGDLKTLVGEAVVAASEDGTHRILREHLNRIELCARAEGTRRELAQSRRRSERTTRTAPDDGDSAPDAQSAVSQTPQ